MVARTTDWMEWVKQGRRHEHDVQPTPSGLITLTVNEFRRLFDALLLAANHTVRACWPGHDGTSTEPDNATTTAARTNDLDLQLQY